MDFGPMLEDQRFQVYALPCLFATTNGGTNWTRFHLDGIHVSRLLFTEHMQGWVMDGYQHVYAMRPPMVVSPGNSCANELCLL